MIGSRSSEDPRKRSPGPRLPAIAEMGARPGRALVFALILPLALAACGRAGPLDPPPGPASATPAPLPPRSGPAPTTFIDPTTPLGTAQPAPAPVQTTQVQPAPPAQKKSFILDPLIQ